MTDAGWTREMPAVPISGAYYWWKFRNSTPEILYCRSAQLVTRPGETEPYLLSDFDGGEWLGPISPSTYHQGRVAGLKEAEKVAREWPWDRGPAHTNPLHVAKRKGERGASWCIAENIQSMIPLEHQAQGGKS